MARRVFYDTCDAVVFKHESVQRGKPLGPAWLRIDRKMTPLEPGEDGRPRWMTLAAAEAAADMRGLPLEEV